MNGDDAPLRVLTAARVLTATHDWSPGWIAVAGERVHSAGPGVAPPELSGAAQDDAAGAEGVLIPGFVDMHVHGALGYDFATAQPEQAAKIAEYHLSRGTTTLLASIASSRMPEVEAAIRTLAPLVEDGTLAGLHLEGPYLAPSFRGAHDRDLLRAPDLAEVQRVIEAGRGAISVVTLAPELPGAEEVIRWLAENGVRTALGHSGADGASTRRAVDAGATIATHLFNGMPSIHHREVGIAGALLLDDRVTLELILDGHHVDRAAVELVERCAPGRIAAVSDAMAATGFTDGVYRVAGSAVRVDAGVATLVDRGTLAGSTITLHEAFAELLSGGTRTLSDAVHATSTSAAKALGLAADLHPGSYADLLVVRGAANRPRVDRVMRRGAWVG